MLFSIVLLNQIISLITGTNFLSNGFTWLLNSLGIYTEDVVELMVSPIINEGYDFVKSAFSREGGRVTELVAKPLLELLFADVAAYEQPLSGVIAGKTEFFNKITLEKDYGVDIGILLDMIKMNANIKEQFIGKIDNNSQSWKSLPMF